MAKNFPGPYELRFQYSVNGRIHELRHSVNVTSAPVPGDLFTTITGTTRSGAIQSLSAWVDSVWGELAPRFSASATIFGVVELWKYTPLTFQSAFISSFQTAVLATALTAVQTDVQATYTFRTLEGGIMKIVLLDSIAISGDIILYPTSNADNNTIFELFVDPLISLALGRDTSFAFAAMNYCPGQNEVLFRNSHR